MRDLRQDDHAQLPKLVCKLVHGVKGFEEDYQGMFCNDHASSRLICCYCKTDATQVIGKSREENLMKRVLAES